LIPAWSPSLLSVSNVVRNGSRPGASAGPASLRAYNNHQERSDEAIQLDGRGTLRVPRKDNSLKYRRHRYYPRTRRHQRLNSAA